MYFSKSYFKGILNENRCILLMLANDPTGPLWTELELKAESKGKKFKFKNNISNYYC